MSRRKPIQRIDVDLIDTLDVLEALYRAVMSGTDPHKELHDAKIHLASHGRALSVTADPSK